MKTHSKQLTLLIVLALVLTLNSPPVQPASAITLDSQIQILPDGTVEGTDQIAKNDNIYTLTADIFSSVGNGACLISIQKDGVVLEGNGRKILGVGTGVGIQLSGVSNVVVKGLVIENFGIGVDVGSKYNVKTDGVFNATNNQILNNHIASTYDGIQVLYGGNNLIKDNTITSPPRAFGIIIQKSLGNSIVDNKFFGGCIGIYEQQQNTFSGNTLDGKPIVVLEGVSRQVVDGAAQVLLYNCKDMTVRNISPNGNLKVAVGFYGTNNSQIQNCKGNIILENSHYNQISKNQLTGKIEMVLSHNNQVSQNTIASTEDYAINMEFCLNNNIQSNTISAQGKVSIGMVGSNGNYLHGNAISGCATGIELAYTHFKNHPTVWPPICVDNSVFANSIAGCSVGLKLHNAQNNTVYANNITGCAEAGVRLFLAHRNIFFHNNFIDNKADIYEQTISYIMGQPLECFSEDVSWDDGYPSGGNYWSAYIGVDSNGDGIGDTPYTATANHTDNYPLMKPFTIQDSATAPPPFQNKSGENSNEPANAQSQELPQMTALFVGLSATLICVGFGLMVYRKKYANRKLMVAEFWGKKKLRLIFRLFRHVV